MSTHWPTVVGRVEQAVSVPVRAAAARSAETTDGKTERVRCCSDKQDNETNVAMVPPFSGAVLDSMAKSRISVSGGDIDFPAFTARSPGGGEHLGHGHRARIRAAVEHPVARPAGRRAE